MYVATQHREDPNLFYVTPINERGEANPDETMAINIADPEWWIGLDDLVRASIEQAIDDARQQVEGMKSDSGDKPAPPEQPRGKQAFDMQFGSRSPSGFKESGRWGTQGARWDHYSPSGFKESGRWGTQGPAWDQRSPSGWNAPGGWSIYGNPIPAQERIGMYVDNWRRSQGMDPTYEAQAPKSGISYDDAKKMVEETERNMEATGAGSDLMQYVKEINRRLGGRY